MATRTISTKLAIEGESAYKASITNINSEIAKLTSALKLTKSEFQNHQNSLEALQEKTAALSKIQQAQTEKVNKLKEAYANAQSALNTYQGKTDQLRSALEKNESALSSLDGKTKSAGKQWNEYSIQMASAEAELERLRKTSGDTTEQEAKLEAEIADCKQKMSDLDAATEGTASTAGKLLSEHESLTAELNKSTAGQEAATKACNNWEKQLNNAQIQLNNTNADLELTEKYMKEAEQATDHCATSIDEFGKTASDSGESAADSMNNLQNTITALAIADAIKEISEAFIECAVAAGDFEAQMSTVEAISGATSAEMENLTDLSMTMGRTTKYTSTEAGQALEYMAMAGWSAAEMAEGLDSVLNLAAAANTDLGTTSDIVTDALTAFGLKASDTAHFADVLAQASASANTDVEMMGETFTYAGAICGSLGISIEDAAVATGLMANAGIKASQAGTALRSGLSRMASPTVQVAAAMEKYNIALDTYSDGSVNLMGTMENIRDAFSGMSDVEEAAAAKTIFGTNAMTGWMAIADASEESFDALCESIDNCSGAAEKMADTKMDNFSGQITLLESAADGLSIAVGEDLTPALGGLAEIATNVLNWITTIVDENPGIVAGISGVVAGVGTLVGGLTLLTAAVNLIPPAIAAVTAAMAANPIGLAAVAVSALAAGVGTLIGVLVTQEAETSESADRFNSLVQAVNDTKEAYDELNDSNGEQKSSNKQLIASLDQLLEKEDKAASDYERITDIVDQLNEALPDLNLQYDQQTDSINITSDALEDYIDLQSQQADYAADVEYLNDLYDQQGEIADQLTTAQEALTEAQNNYDEAVQENGGNVDMYNTSITNAAAAVGQANTMLGELTQMQEDNSAAITEAEEKVNSYSDAVTGMSSAEDSAESSAAVMQEVLSDLQEAYSETYEEAQKSIQGQMELWDQADEVVATDSEDMISALESQAEYWNTYADNLDSLYSRSIDGLDEMVSAIDDGSSDSAAYIAGMVSMSDEELSKLVEKYGSVQTAQDRTADSVAEMASGYKKTAAQVEKTASDMASGMDKSAEAKKSGSNTVTGYASGVTAAQAMAERSTGTVASKAIAEFGKKSSPTTMNSYGQQTIQGYINGANNKSGSLYSKMASLASGALEAFKKKLGINSPSREFAILAGYSIDGYENQIDDRLPGLERTMSNAAAVALDSFNVGVSDGLVSEIDVKAKLSSVSGVAARNDATYQMLKKISENTGEPNDNSDIVKELQTLKSTMTESFTEAVQTMSIDWDGREIGRVVNSKVKTA